MKIIRSAHRSLFMHLLAAVGEFSIAYPLRMAAIMISFLAIAVVLTAIVFGIAHYPWAVLTGGSAGALIAAIVIISR